MTQAIPPAVLPALSATIAAHRYPLLFVTVSGAHLYGFASPDSDFDLRGVHILPARDVLGLDRGEATVEQMQRGTPEIDLVTHDVEKFFRLLLKPNGYVLEQLYSPLVLHSTPEFEELKTIARGCITRHHIHHYRGFSENQWSLFERGTPRRIKPLLYVYRVLLTGIHLMRTGEVEGSLVRLSEELALTFVDELIERKVSGSEKVALEDQEIERYRREYERLRSMMEEAFASTSLPEVPSARPALNALLLRLRGA